MLGEMHLNRVLYKMKPFASKALYRQIVVLEQEQFQVRIFEGRIVQTDPRSSRQDRTQKCTSTRPSKRLSTTRNPSTEEHRQRPVGASQPSVTAVPIVHRGRVTMIDAASAHLFAPVVSDA